MAACAPFDAEMPFNVTALLISPDKNTFAALMFPVIKFAALSAAKSMISASIFANSLKRISAETCDLREVNQTSVNDVVKAFDHLQNLA